MPLSDYVKERLEYVASYVQHYVTDWFVLKIVILQSMTAKQRKLLGMAKRHRSTKKMFVNDVDLEVIAYWKLLTGVDVLINPEKLHDPKWVSRPRGWALNGGKKRLLQAETKRKTDGNSSSDH